jgi:cold shock CspA family protein
MQNLLFLQCAEARKSTTTQYTPATHPQTHIHTFTCAPCLSCPRRAILIQRFLQPSSTEDTFAHVATVLPNVTKLKAGRRVLLEPGRGTLSALASQLRSANKLRRRGCAGAIKNCCFSCEDDGNVDAIAVEKEALAEILAVLADTESRAAKDEIVRENLADAVLCLAKVPSARKKLWEANAPELLKKAYEFEEHAGTCEAMESAAALFLEDGFVPQGEDEVKEDDLVLPASETRTSSVHIEEID